MSRILTLIANPGSESRKYALYHAEVCIARLHFEKVDGAVVCNLWQPTMQEEVVVDVANISVAAGSVEKLLHQAKICSPDEHITQIVLRVVAPSTYFLEDHVVDDEFVRIMEKTAMRAPIHITATLSELKHLRKAFTKATVVAVSDSAFHNTKPDYARHYGLPFEDAERLDVKRFGFHGLSVAAAVDTMQTANKLLPKMVVCHLGGGASVSAVLDGKSVDNSMGYSPLEGLVMATRTGTIDQTAVAELQRELNMDAAQTAEYLNKKSGLLGLSGVSSDIRELLVLEEQGNARAALALNTYVYAVQKTIGQMVAVLGGVDSLAFTGTIGERSVVMRERILEKMTYLGFRLDVGSNAACTSPHTLTLVSMENDSKPVYVVPTDEATQMLKAAQRLF